VQGRAKSLNIPTHITIDAGRTQIAPSEFFRLYFIQFSICLISAVGLIMFPSLLPVDSRTVMAILGKLHSNHCVPQFSVICAI
jgi:hypothetical protein